jgi:hypothetical protein
MLNGDLKKARIHYEKAKEAEEDKVDLKNIEWDLNYLQAVEKPVPLDEAYMQKLAGDYGPRHIMIKDGKLCYFREGGTVGETRPLLARAKDQFYIEGVVWFYFKVEFDDHGIPTKLVGNYDDGRTDETKRTK